MTLLRRIAWLIAMEVEIVVLCALLLCVTAGVLLGGGG